MTGYERIKLLTEGKRPDRAPAALWYHVPAVDRDADVFAHEIIRIAEEYDWDLVKVQENSQYITEAYGAEIEFYTHPDLNARKNKRLLKVLRHPVTGIEDLRNLEEVSITEAPSLLREVRAIGLIARHFKGVKPVLPTLFSPYTWLVYMTEGGHEALREFAADDASALHHALQAVDRVNRALADAFIDAGADGFFYATSYTSPHIVTFREYEEFHKNYDLPFLADLQGRTWFNMLHIHGNTDLYIEELSKYPAESFNWERVSLGAAEPQLTSGRRFRELTDKVLIGGADQWHDFYGKKEVLDARFDERFALMNSEIDDGRFVFGAGCSLPLDITDEALKAFRATVDRHPFE